MDGVLSDDTRGLSETAGVAILIGFTIVVTATVGVQVLVAEEDDAGPTDANFTYDYVETTNALIVTHAEGDELPAGDVTINESDRGVTWAALAGTNETATVSRGDAVQLSAQNAWGSSVGPSDRVEIYFARDGNATKLSEWGGR